MTHEMLVASIQAENLNRIRHAENFGHHYADVRHLRRQRRAGRRLFRSTLRSALRALLWLPRAVSGAAAPRTAPSASPTLPSMRAVTPASEPEQLGTQREPELTSV